MILHIRIIRRTGQQSPIGRDLKGASHQRRLPMASSTDVVDRASLREEMAGGDLGDDRLNPVAIGSSTSSSSAGHGVPGSVERRRRGGGTASLESARVAAAASSGDAGPLSRPGRGRDSRHDEGPGATRVRGDRASSCGPGRVGRGPASPLAWCPCCRLSGSPHPTGASARDPDGRRCRPAARARLGAARRAIHLMDREGIATSCWRPWRPTATSFVVRLHYDRRVVPDGEVPAPGRLREALPRTAVRIERGWRCRRVAAQRTPLLTRQPARRPGGHVALPVTTTAP